MSAVQPCVAHVTFTSALSSGVVERAGSHVQAETSRHLGLVISLGPDMLRVFGPANGEYGSIPHWLALGN